MSAAEQENNCESIHQYVHTHTSAELQIIQEVEREKVKNSTDPEIKSLCEKWMKLCGDLNIDLHYIRCKMDDWFMEVYRSRDQLNETNENISTERVQTRKTALYWKFYDDYDKVFNNAIVLDKIQMNAARDKIQEKFGHRPDDWVDLATQCVQAEVELLKTYSTARLQSVQMQQAIQKVQQDINDASQLRMAINDELKALQSKVSDLREIYERRDETQEHFREYQAVRPSLHRQNGSIPDQNYFKTEIDQMECEINNAKDQLQSLRKQVSRMFQELYDILSDLVINLKSKVKEWQQEFQFNYAEMVASPDLDKIAPWCAHTGLIIHDVLHGSIVNWQNILCSVPNNSFGELDGDCQTYTELFHTIMTDFIQSTFVVTEQGNFFIKTGNKRFPKFSVRVLAADLFSKHSEETTAHFVSEDDLRQCCLRSCFDHKHLEKSERKLKSNKIKFSAENGKDKMECCFQNLQFAQSFKRSNKEINKQVHEEKYRVVFVTKLESVTCWTLSLPLVVTTASNQEAHSLASIMWQCFSTDVFSPGSDIPEEMPWSKVAGMLQKKMSRLSTKHRLSQENINHLKDRLFGEENLPDDTPVNLTQFCWNYMHDTEFSFWKWFLGVYNLIEQYLQQFWNDGLITGFLKKEAAEQMLARCDQAGTFILRFSDKHFTNSDGRKSVYGRLTSCVVVMKEGKGNKRSSSSVQEPSRKKVVEHVDVADFKKLGGELKKQDADDGPKNNLANILKETWIKGRDGQSQVQMYRYLYPSRKSREELFDKYCEEGSTVSGYRHTREAYIAILEQAMTKVSISKKEAESVSLGADMNSQLGAACTKKPRRSRDNVERIKRSPRRSSSCQSNISTPQGSPFPVQSPQSQSHSPFHATHSPGPPSMSPVHPTQSPYPLSSPAQSVPSPAFSIQMHSRQNIDVMVPGSDDKSRLPTFLTDDFTGSSVVSFSHQETSRTFSKMQSSDNFQTGANVTAQRFDAMEVSSENQCLFNRANQMFSPEATMITDSNFSKAADNMTLREGDSITMGGDVLSVQHGSMSLGDEHLMGNPVVSQERDNTLAEEFVIAETGTGENQEDQVVFIVTKNGDQFGLNTGKIEEQQSDITLPTSPRVIQEQANYQVSGLTPSQFEQVQRWLEENRRAAETVLQHTQSTTVGTSTSDTPVSTSSGSSGELFGYSRSGVPLSASLAAANQLAAMGSGDIDPNFTTSIVYQDTQDGNPSNT